jgi:membrane protein
MDAGALLRRARRAYSDNVVPSFRTVTCTDAARAGIPPGMGSSQATSRIEKLDQWQQRRRGTGVAFATVKKFTEDQSTNLAGLIAFWAFFSIFPLLLVLVTLLGWFLAESVKNDVLTSVAQMFPLLDPSQISGLSGSWWALIVGLLTALWSGTGVVRTVETAFSAVWEIPMTERPGMVEKTVRALKALATIGLGLVATTLLSGYLTGSADALGLGFVGQLLGYAITIALDIGLFVAAFWMLTDRRISARDVLPGAVLSGVVFFLLQQLSGWIISNRLQSAESTYGSFATVITLLWWFYLQGIVTMLGAQLNVVLKQDLWPRSLIGGPDTEADHKAYEAYADERTYHDDEKVDTEFTADSDRKRAARSKAPQGRPRD